MVGLVVTECILRHIRSGGGVDRGCTKDLIDAGGERARDRDIVPSDIVPPRSGGPVP